MAAKDGGRMPLLQHLRELRKRFFKASLAIAVGGGFGFYFYTEIITFLSRPVCDLDSVIEEGSDHCGSLIINGILGPLNLQFKVAILTGVIVAAPIWLYQLWAFIAPALHRKEKRYTFAFLISATPFFAAGAYLGYITLPLAVRFLLGLTPSTLMNFVPFDDYLEFVLRIILVFGLAFELPVFLVTFNLIGFLSGRAILKPWRIWVFGIFFFIASFSPSADPLSMIALAVPLIAFYLLAGLIATLNDRRRDKKRETVMGSNSSLEPSQPLDRILSDLDES
jgi:sec-independent protein translocase protein TatC